MQATRRAVLAGLGAIGLSGCVGGGGGPAVSRGPEPGMTPVPDAGWDAWVAGFKGRAAGRGISGGTLDMAFRDAGFLPGVIEKDRNQTEFTRSLEDYLAIAASDERRVQGARGTCATYGGVLSEIEARYGVEAQCRGGGLGAGKLLWRAAGEHRGDLGPVHAGL